MLGTVIVSSLVWARPDNLAVWLLIFVLLFCGGLGFWDDYLKVSKKNSAGVSERTKLVAQAALAEVAAYHRREPLARGLPRETLRERHFAHAAPGQSSDVGLARAAAGDRAVPDPAGAA